MIVGIDLGTSYAKVAAVIDGKPVVFPDERGRTSQPSIVAFPEGGGVLVGWGARPHLCADPENTVFSAKRLIGRRFADGEVAAFQAAVPYRIVEGPGGRPAVQARGKPRSIPEISAYVLRAMKQIAERHLRAAVQRAVVTVPANFNDAQREATRIAGRIAGLEVVRMVNEPTAAAIAYGFGRGLDRTIAVYDFGGGTFDVTVLDARDAIFRVIATGGDMLLGGDDFDQALALYAHDEFWRERGIELRRMQVEWARLVIAAEACKRKLSARADAEVAVPRVAHTRQGLLDLRVPVTRDRMNALVMAFVQRSFTLCAQVLATTDAGAAQIDDLVLVGGTTRVPLVRVAAEQFFRRKAGADVDPETAVAVGAAIHAASLDAPASPEPEAGRVLLLDVLPRTIGVAAAGGFTDPVIHRSTAIPVEQTRVFATGRDGQNEVRIVVVQGESRKTRENVVIGELVADGLRAAPRGEVEIEVTFEVDASGILHVTARDRDSGRVLKKRMTISGGLDDNAVAQARERVDEDWKK